MPESLALTGTEWLLLVGDFYYSFSVAANLVTLPYLRGGGTGHVSAEASIWAQCATPTDLVVDKKTRGFCKPQEKCPVDTVKSVQ